MSKNRQRNVWFLYRFRNHKVWFWKKRRKFCGSKSKSAEENRTKWKIRPSYFFHLCTFLPPVFDKFVLFVVLERWERNDWHGGMAFSHFLSNSAAKFHFIIFVVNSCTECLVEDWIKRQHEKEWKKTTLFFFFSKWW